MNPAQLMRQSTGWLDSASTPPKWQNHLMPRESPADKAARFDRIIRAWEEFAPSRTFGMVTLARFKAAVQLGYTARTEIVDLQSRTRHAIVRRNAADLEAVEMAKYIVTGVKGDPDHSEDGALYAAMGFIPRHVRRKPGPRRKK